jgi:hypothetical protein
MRNSLTANLRMALFGIAPIEARLDRRGFAATTADKQGCLENAGRSFIHGYLSALASADAQRSASDCEMLSIDLRGFAYEGSAMGLALIDLMGSGRPRLFNEFVQGSALSHIYMAHVGAGWAVARCPWGILTFLHRLDPLLKWLAMDGLGFHEGYFHPSRFIGARRSSWFRRRAPELFDNGLGRAIWFASGARVERVIQNLTAFPPERRAALWSGIGLAATYAGGASKPELEEMLSAAGNYREELAQGAAFAAKARCRAGYVNENTEMACGIFCEMNAKSAAKVTDECMALLNSKDSQKAYFAWQRAIRKKFARCP